MGSVMKMSSIISSSTSLREDYRQSYNVSPLFRRIIINMHVYCVYRRNPSSLQELSKVTYQVRAHLLYRRIFRTDEAKGPSGPS